MCNFYSITTNQAAFIALFRVVAFTVVLAAASDGSTLAFASSCNRIVIEQIRFAKGAVCWYYTGKATHFRGSFQKGQLVTVEMSGEIWEAIDDQPYTSKPRWTARLPNIEGPQGFFAEPKDALDETPSGKLEAELPQTGQYTFSFSPCAMTNNYGHVAICASTPPR